MTADGAHGSAWLPAALWEVTSSFIFLSTTCLEWNEIKQTQTLYHSHHLINPSCPPSFQDVTNWAFQIPSAGFLSLPCWLSGHHSWHLSHQICPFPAPQNYSNPTRTPGPFPRSPPTAKRLTQPPLLEGLACLPTTWEKKAAAKVRTSCLVLWHHRHQCKPLASMWWDTDWPGGSEGTALPPTQSPRGHLPPKSMSGFCLPLGPSPYSFLQHPSLIPANNAHKY